MGEKEINSPSPGGPSGDGTTTPDTQSVSSDPNVRHSELVSAQQQLDARLIEAAREPVNTAPAALPMPAQIGPYRILETLGEGGMGTVYLAEQIKPVRRRVAIKLVKLGMDTREVVARFESERQALAMMNHPNVATVFDAGATEQGSPYFVMEYVAGISITEHCDRHKLRIDERLDLLVQVCDAVQHAHQKGIIHRDLKPSNILVAFHDGKAVPKVIDFGVAKALFQRLTDKTIFTEMGRLIGTPEYMSPEQAERTSQDIDTRSDIYSLGVLLYELLTGQLPFDPKSFRRAALEEIARILREVEPAKPSTRLSTLMTTRSEDSSLVARNRQLDVRTLARKVRGDLDWVTMKCLDKDRSRRYQTADSLAQEIRRYLHHEPVLAGPPGTAYRIRKFVRRHYGAFMAGSLLAASLLAGIAGTTAFAMRESDAREVADQQRDKAEKFADFMEQTLSGVGPLVALGRDTAVLRELMDAAAQRIEAGELKAVPEAELRLRQTIGAVYLQIGALDAAERMLGPTVEMSRSLYGETSAQHAEALTISAMLQLEKGDAEAGLGQHQAALAIRKQLYQDDHPDVAASLNNVASSHQALGHADEALSGFQNSLAMYQRLDPNDSLNIATSLNNVALCLHDFGRDEEALPLFQDALERNRKLFQGDHPLVAASLHNLALCLRALGRSEEALSQYQTALEMYRRIFHGDHDQVAMALDSVGRCLKALGRQPEALSHYQAALEMNQRLYRGDHPDVAQSLNSVAMCLQDLGRVQESLTPSQAALEMFRRLYKEDHPDVANCLGNVASCLQNLGRTREALPQYQAALQMWTRIYRGDHLDIALGLQNVASCLRVLGRKEEALADFRAGLEMFKRLYHGDHRYLANSMSNVAACLVYLDRPQEALPYNQAALQMWRRLYKNDHSDVALSLHNNAFCLLTLHRAAEAEPMLREALAMRKRLFLDGDARAWLKSYTTSVLGQSLVEQAADPSLAIGLRIKRLKEAEPQLLESYNQMKTDPNVPPPAAIGADRKGDALERIIKLYDTWHNVEPDKGHDQKAATWRARQAA